MNKNKFTPSKVVKVVIYIFLRYTTMSIEVKWIILGDDYLEISQGHIFFLKSSLVTSKLFCCFGWFWMEWNKLKVLVLNRIIVCC